MAASSSRSKYEYVSSALTSTEVELHYVTGNSSDEVEPLLVERSEVPEEVSSLKIDLRSLENLEQVKQIIVTLQETSRNLNSLLGEATDKSVQRPKRFSRRKPKIPKWITDNLLILTFLWQILFVGIMSILDLMTSKNKNVYVFYTSVIFMAAIQLLHLVLVMSTTVKLTKQVLHHSVTPMFMARSYLSTILLFAGLYSVTFRMWPHHWKEMADNHDESTLMVTLFIKMLFFSVSTGTLCGAAHVIPSTWYLYIIVGIQMVLSFVYFASILSISLNPPPKLKEKPASTVYGTGRRISSK